MKDIDKIINNMKEVVEAFENMEAYEEDLYEAMCEALEELKKIKDKNRD